METEKSIQAQNFQGQAMHLLEEIKRHGSGYVITQKGKPIAKLVPYKDSPLEGSILEQGDVISPIDEKWEAMS